ncbi:MAG: DUF4190 domain-containing protein [Nitrospinae bacterium]|nr:DUF4190 domain-containing protein [Nitrospinota bacterium]
MKGYKMTNRQISHQTIITPSTHPMAIVSISFGIIGLFFIFGSVVAIITGKKALKKIHTAPVHYTGEGLAKAGVIMGWIEIALIPFVILGVILFFINPKYVITYVEILIFVSAMFFVGYPIFKRQEARVKTQENEALGELIHKKEAVYTSIKDLDFDYRTGKLSEDDYKELKEKYEVEALHILKDIDDSGKKKTAVDEARAKQILPESAEPTTGKDFIFCPKCGTKAKMGDNFCFKCGAKLPVIQ